ncbi:hypothetical protein [Sinomonas flava]|uniref:hypothetical protein n=1 Tax=Sinomonas flava TaxID=496857 RepID=UPI0039A48918
MTIESADGVALKRAVPEPGEEIVFSPWMILVAALLSAGLAAAAARLLVWKGRPLALAAAGVFVAVLGWRLLANVLGLNEDYLPAVSVADTVCLLAGGLPPALVAAATRPLPRRAWAVGAGAAAAFIVNVVVL